MNEPSLEVLTNRVARLERTNRYWRVFFAVAFLVAAPSLTTGQATRPPQVIEAEQFILKDAAGRGRGQLGVDKDGSVGLILDSPSGSIKLAIDGTGVQSLKFHEPDGRPKVILNSFRDGTATLNLFRNDGLGALLSVGADRTTSLTLFGVDRHIRMSALQGSTSISVATSGHGNGFEIQIFDWAQMARLRDKHGNVIWKAP